MESKALYACSYACNSECSPYTLDWYSFTSEDIAR
jgi:hypothetical protein